MHPFTHDFFPDLRRDLIVIYNIARIFKFKRLRLVQLLRFFRPARVLNISTYARWRMHLLLIIQYNEPGRTKENKPCEK